MRVCGIEIKSRTATLVVLEETNNVIKMVQTKPLKIELEDPSIQLSIKTFSASIQDFFTSHNVEKVVVKEGISKGKFSSGSSVFKIETIIQLSDVDVELIKPQTLSAFLKKDSPGLESENLKKYQHVAFQVAYYGLKA